MYNEWTKCTFIDSIFFTAVTLTSSSAEEAVYPSPIVISYSSCCIF